MLGENLSRPNQVELGVGAHQVPDENRCARAGRADGRGRAADTRQVLQRGVHLAELDAAPTDLDLIVRAALEEQALELEPHQIATAIGAVPAETRHRRVLLGVLGGIEIPREPDAADHQFADLPDGNRLFVGTDHRQIPAVERQSDAHRPTAVHEGRARHHGRLGGAVGVPDLASRNSQALRQIRRAGLTAEDQQAHVLEGLARPECGESGHGGHHGDVPCHEPGSEVHPRAHERARRRHQTRTGTPREPHLLARRVEGHRQSGEHSVARAEGAILQEQPGLGIDERGRVAVAHRDALRGAGGAGREDHPRVVVDRGVPHRASRADAPGAGDAALGHDRGHPGLGEHQISPLVGIVDVDRDVRRSRRDHRQDGRVQAVAARRHAYPDAVTGADAVAGEPLRALGDVDHQLRVGDDAVPVVHRRGVGEPLGRVGEDVDQRARRSGGRGTQKRLGDRGVRGHLPGGLFR